MGKGKLLFLLLLLLTVTFFLRLPSIFEPYWYGDEGITLTVGQQLNRGLSLYKDVVDNKTPLLYFLAALTTTLFNFKLLTLFWVLISLLCFLKLVRLLIPKGQILAGLIFIFLSSTPILEGNIVNGEIYGLLPMTVSVYFFYKKAYFLSGVFACFSFLFKQPFFFEFLGLLVFLILFNRASFKDLLLKLSKSIAGFLLPLSWLVIFFYQQGNLTDFLHHSILNNLEYISWKTDVLLPQGLTLIKSLVLIFFLIFILNQKEKISKKEAFISFWLIFSLFGATISIRPYPHYLLQIVPSLSLMMVISFNRLKILFIILLLVVNALQFNLSFNSFHYLLAYYQNFLKGNSYDFYSKKVKITYEIAAFLKANTSSNEPIFVWGDNALIYALSQRPLVGKYIAAYHVAFSPARKKETIQNLSLKKPRLIILTLSVKHPFPELATFLKEEYNLLKENVNYQIYEKENLKNLEGKKI